MADRIADTYGAQRYMDGLCDGLNEEYTKQEQPEVDFEKEYAKFSNDPEADFAFPIDLADYKDFALHFFELGRNARKEE